MKTLAVTTLTNQNETRVFLVQLTPLSNKRHFCVCLIIFLFFSALHGMPARTS